MLGAHLFPIYLGYNQQDLGMLQFLGEVLSSQSGNLIGSVVDSWSLWLLCKPEVLLPLAAALFPWATGDT